MPPPRTSSPRTTALRWAAALSACIAAGAPAAGAAPDPEPPRTVEQAIIALARTDGDDEARAAGAAFLLLNAEDRRALGALEAALQHDSPDGARRLVAEAIARRREAPARLVRALRPALADAMVDPLAEAEALAVIRALGAVPSRDAVSTLLSALVLLDPPPPTALLRAGFAALRAQTGLDSLGENREAWSEWWGRARWWPEAQWRSEIMLAQAATANRLREQRNAAARRLAEAYRRLHALMPEEARGGLLVEMLSADETEVRRAGFELIMVALLNAKPVGESVAAAAAIRLTDPDPGIRAQAGRVLELIDLPGAEGALQEALQKETDGEAAAAMLRAAARRPAPDMTDLALRWLGAGRAAEAAAVEALLAVLRAEQGSGGPAIGRVEEAIRSRQQAGGLTPPLMRLAVAIGALDTITPLLSDDDDRTATAAAEALGESPAGLAPLLEAAAARPVLFETAARALTRLRPTADGYARAAALPSPGDEARAAALSRYAAALPPSELVLLARGERDPASRDALLSPLVTREFFAQTTDLTDRVELALILGRARLRLGRPAEALAVLDLLPSAWHGMRVLTLRVTILLCLNRPEDAIALLEPPEPAAAPPPEAAADAWLDALELCGRFDGADEMRRRFAERYGPALNAAQKERFAALGGAPPAPEGAAPAGNGGT